MIENQLSSFLVWWMVILATLAGGRMWRQTPGVGLVLAYALNLWLIHWVAPAMYLLPGYRNLDVQTVVLGLEQSTVAIGAFTAGSLLVAPLFLPLVTQASATSVVHDARLPKAYLWLGLLFYAALSSFGSLPTLTAVFSTGQQLIVVGVALSCWQAWHDGDQRRLFLWLGSTVLMPLGTILTRGFIGYGAAATLSVVVFMSGFLKSWTKLIAGGVLVGYLGLSVYVTYMRDRGSIRETVWGGQAYSERLAQLETTFSKFEFFDPLNGAHLLAIDSRLNQSYFVGLTASRLSGTENYAYGRTLWDALLGLIPRALWPDKPMTAGSGNVVSEYTGLVFAAGTSVGIGHVMEFYINFGTTGVVVGFLLLGALVTFLDGAAAASLTSGRLDRFVLLYLPGLSLLQVGGSLVETAASTVASIGVAIVVNGYLARRRSSNSLAARLAPSVNG